MGSMSIWHWVIMSVMMIPLWVLFIWPTWRICTRAGLSGPLALLFLFPPFGLILLWVVAFIQWPVERQQGSART
jgi:hypothetical protein